MGDTTFFQPLTPADKATVVIYRTGIVLSALNVLFFAALNAFASTAAPLPAVRPGITIVFLVTLYGSVGLSVFFIHLYIGKFHRFLKNLYYISLLCLLLLFIIGSGNPIVPFFRTPPYSGLLLIPLALCLGFITAKEAFCFRLFEGYLLAIIMPAYLFFYAVGISTAKGSVYGLFIVAAMLLFFTVRKVFQPLHFDIGDKSAYQP